MFTRQRKQEYSSRRKHHSRKLPLRKLTSQRKQNSKKSKKAFAKLRPWCTGRKTLLWWRATRKTAWLSRKSKRVMKEYKKKSPKRQGKLHRKFRPPPRRRWRRSYPRGDPQDVRDHDEWSDQEVGRVWKGGRKPGLLSAKRHSSLKSRINKALSLSLKGHRLKEQVALFIEFNYAQILSS